MNTPSSFENGDATPNINGQSAADASNFSTPRPELTLFDSTCIIVGIIVAAGVYRSSPTIASLTPSIPWLIGLWLAGGLLSWIGALCYAELATTYPNEGGDYVYLTRAFGRPIGFLFAWCQLWIVRPGSIGAMAYAFAEYANRIGP
jgi:amino acid transporter